MKKRAVLLALAAVLAIGSAAYAYGGSHGSFGGGMGFDGFCGPRMMHRGGNFRDRNVQRVDYPKEILDKISELQRTHLEMRLALAQDEPDVNKAKLLFSKAQGIRNEISLWRSENYIESLKK